MNRDEIIRMIREGNWPEGNGYPGKEQVISDIENLYELQPGSKEYLKLKGEIEGYIAIDGLTQFETGRAEQGSLVKKVLENLLCDLEVMETR